MGAETFDPLGPRSPETMSLGSLFGDAHFLVGLVLEGIFFRAGRARHHLPGRGVSLSRN